MNAQPFPYTHLSLPEYAKILGINPVHFMGASGTNYWTTSGSCEDVWPRHVWQTTEDIVSHEEIINCIYQAESEIAKVLGYYVAPEWDEQYVVSYPKSHNRISYGNHMDVQLKTKGVILDKTRIISPGRRSSSEIETDASVVYSDADSDGWNEIATITVSTDITDSSEIHVYHAGTLANPSWEIRPIKSVSISGGIATIKFDAWNLIDPDQHGAYPTTGNLQSLDIESASTFVSTVDVYRVYNDTSQVSVEFLWEDQSYSGGAIVICPYCGGSGCSKCSLIEQDGCFSIRDANRGVITPFPATYDSENEAWSQVAWLKGRDADQVRLYFQSGLIGQDYLRGWSLNPLDKEMARAIAWLATARISRSPCSCANADSLFRDLRKDLTTSSRNEFNIRFSTMDIFKSPFGFKMGEFRAWQYISTLNQGTEFRGGLL